MGSPAGDSETLHSSEPGYEVTNSVTQQDLVTEIEGSPELNSSKTPPPPLDPLLSYETFVLIQTLVNCGLNPIFLIFGVVTNILSSIVFWRQGLRDRMNFCLCCLAIVDAVYLCTVFTMGAHCMVSPIDPKAGALVATYARNYVSVINEGMMHCSAVITAIISVERCLCVVMPMKAATILKTRAMILLIILSLVTVLLLCCATFLKRIVQVGYDPQSGQLVTRIEVSEMYKAYPAVFDGIYVFVSIVLKVATFVVVSLATAATVFTLKRAIVWREATTSSSEAQHATRSHLALIKMLVVVSCVYIICAIPSVTVMTVRSLMDDFEPWGPYPLTVMCCFMMAQVFTSVNSAINFVVYMLRSSRFRRVLGELIPCAGCLYLRFCNRDVSGDASSNTHTTLQQNSGTI